jgi:hypothetical protein
LAEPKKLPGKTLIGEDESDPLYIVDETGDIICEELHVPGYVLGLVAENGSKFLDALIPAAEFLEKRGLGNISRDDRSSARQAALQCAALAGGDDYLQFYGAMLGADFDRHF